MDRRHASVRAVLLAIAGELLAVINSGEKLDAKTLNAFKEVYRGGDIESEAIVAQLFMALNLEVPTEVTEKKWKKKSPAGEVSKQLDPAEPPVKSTVGKAIAHSSNA